MTPLRKRMTEELQLRNLSPVTSRIYLKIVERFAKHFHTSPECLGSEHIRQWLLYLINDRKVSATTLQVHRAALRFLYVSILHLPWFDEAVPLPKRIRKLPDVIVASDVAAILNRTTNLKHWTILATLYATAIRIDELIHLQVGDIDSKQMMIHIRQGKGRIPAISSCLRFCSNDCASIAGNINPKCGCFRPSSAPIVCWTRERFAISAETQGGALA